MSTNYYFCEPVWATGVKWHIRKEGAKGPMYGGGADTPALCGLEVAWDLEVEINDVQLDSIVCEECKKRYKDL